MTALEILMWSDDEIGTATRMTGHENSTRNPRSRQIPAYAALKLDSRHELRCDSKGQLSDSWAEIER